MKRPLSRHETLSVIDFQHENWHQNTEDFTKSRLKLMTNFVSDKVYGSNYP